MCAALCTNQSNSRVAIAPRCTPVVHPQRLNTGHTVVNLVIHTPARALAAARPGCPQNPHPLILLLSYLCYFFFEVQRWGGFVTLGSRGSRDRACRALRLAFKMASEDLRLFFDCRCGRRGALRATGVRGGRPQGARAASHWISVGEGTLWTRRRQKLASPI